MIQMLSLEFANSRPGAIENNLRLLAPFLLFPTLRGTLTRLNKSRINPNSPRFINLQSGIATVLTLSCGKLWPKAKVLPWPSTANFATYGSHP